MDIWLKSSDYCRYMKFSICGNFKYPNSALAEGIDIFSCLIYAFSCESSYCVSFKSQISPWRRSRLGEI